MINNPNQIAKIGTFASPCLKFQSDNKFNIQSMLLSKSQSLPLIKVNINKFDNFFTNKNFNKDSPLDEEHQQSPQQNIQRNANPQKKAHLKNLDIIDRRSSLKSKVQAYLTDSRKMGILDHNTNQTNNRRSLTRISLQAMKPVRTQVEQQKSYLTKLKGELNSFFQKNQVMQREMKNTSAITTQVREKIIFYEQLLSRSWIHRYELLNQREQNLVYIRYESDRMRFMQERLKEINVLMKKRVKDAQNKLRLSENEAVVLNEIEGIKQAELDNKQYLLKHYQQFQLRKTDIMEGQTGKAMKNMKENLTTEILRRHQSSINIMDQHDYQLDLLRINHNKLISDILMQTFCSKLLESMWTKYSSYYQSYEKSEQLIKMHCMDRNYLVQDSYKRSFEVRGELQQKIKEKEAVLEGEEAKNKTLKEEYAANNFDQIEDIERKVNQMKIQFKTGKQMQKNALQSQERQQRKRIFHRLEQAQRAKQLYIRLKQWTVKREKTLDLSISKKSSLSDHLNQLIKHISDQLQKQQQKYTPLQPKQATKRLLSKVSKNINMNSNSINKKKK